MNKMYPPLLILDFGLDVVDGVRGLHLKGDGLAGQGLHENLHGSIIKNMCTTNINKNVGAV